MGATLAVGQFCLELATDTRPLRLREAEEDVSLTWGSLLPSLPARPASSDRRSGTRVLVVAVGFGIPDVTHRTVCSGSVAHTPSREGDELGTAMDVLSSSQAHLVFGTGRLFWLCFA